MLEPLTNQIMTVMLIVVLINALALDLHDRRIPNPLIGVGLLAGIAGHVWLSGIPGLGVAVAGAVTGLLCLLPFYVSGGMGAGDVKLMAVCGAFLGPLHVVVAAAATLMLGGVLAVLWLLGHNLVTSIQTSFQLSRNDGPAQAGDQTATSYPLPYAVAIVAGVLAELQVASSLAATWAGGVH